MADNTSPDPLDPALIQALAQAGMLDDYLGLDKYALGRAREHAETPLPQGMIAEPGYIAPNLLSFLATGIRRGTGISDEARIQALMAQRLRDYSGTAGQYRAALGQAQMQPQAQQPGTPPLLQRPPEAEQWSGPPFGASPWGTGG